ncbi:hypothetical protein AHAS_Ahas11G0256500 [Arachis hypogaea]
MAHSSSSSSNKTQTVFQTTFEETFQFLAKSRRNQEQKIQISKIKSAEKRKKHYSRTQSKKSKLIVEDSSPEQTQSYHESEIGTEELEEFLRESKKKKNNEKSTTQGEKGADLRSTEGHYDSSETISDISLGSDDHLSQGHTDQSSINKLVESM